MPKIIPLTKEDKKIIKNYIETVEGRKYLEKLGFLPPARFKAKEINKKLTIKQRRFVREYLKTGNGTQSALKAGYSKKTAGAIAFENLKNPKINKLIKEEREEALRECGIDAKYIVQNFKKIFSSNSRHIPLTRIYTKGDQVKIVKIKDVEGNDVLIPVNSMSAIRALESLKDIAELNGSSNINVNQTAKEQMENELQEFLEAKIAEEEQEA